MLKKPRVRSPFTTGLQHVNRTQESRFEHALNRISLSESVVLTLDNIPPSTIVGLETTRSLGRLYRLRANGQRARG
eukprot:815278-Prymnesium_polylepis.2